MLVPEFSFVQAQLKLVGNKFILKHVVKLMSVSNSMMFECNQIKMHAEVLCPCFNIKQNVLSNTLKNSADENGLVAQSFSKPVHLAMVSVSKIMIYNHKMAECRPVFKK